MARSGALNVYIEHVSPRARWIFSLILEELLGLRIKLTSNPEHGPVLLNYSGRHIPEAVNIVPYGLLAEEEIREQDVRIMENEGMKTLFPVEGGDLAFDPFSMAFYLVSRYEEYLPFEADKHGRYPHTESLAFREEFHDKAVVNRLSLLLKGVLQEKFAELEFKLQEYKFVPTVDVDIAFAHLGKGLIRTYGSMARLLFQGNINEISRRLKTMQGKAEDPYDNFSFLLDSFDKHKLDSLFFILAGDPGQYDRNLSTNDPKFASLLKKLSDRAGIGVHPSYASGNDVGQIRKEAGRIAKVTGREVSKSRQHFVKMSIPQTYEALIEAGITDDYSMGFASTIGFRAGIASSFNFYNLKKEEETSLRIHPFVFMDSTLSDYMGLPAAEYLNAVKPLIREVKDVNGTLTGIWHNYTLEDDAEKHQAFEAILNLAAEK